MKAKKIISGMSIAASMLLMSCDKKPAIAPQPDTEFGTSLDVSRALFSITDAEMMGSFMAENYPDPLFYVKIPGTNGSVSTPGTNLNSDDVNLGFDNTSCVDGSFRYGTINLARAVNPDYNPYANPNSRYYRRFGFSGRLTMSDYHVNDWGIVTTDADNNVEGQPLVILNKLTSANFDPATTNLSWSIKGNVKLTKGDEMIFCKLDLVKTLVNTSDPAVYPRIQTASINWPLATVAYSGKITGFTQGNVPFTMTIDERNPIIRDFTCSPDRVASIASDGSQRHTEFHPFKNGVAYFTTGKLYQREIYYGGSEATDAGQCDNSGAIVIKGISYPVDFKK